jgi:DNA-binding NtrC family response regulator
MKSKVRLLIVEDEPTSAEPLQMLLEGRGYTTRVAASGEEAEETVRSWSPTFALIDLMLPDTDGVDLLRRVRPIAPDMQAVVISGHGSISRAVEAMQAGAVNFLEKPIDASALLTMLEQASARMAAGDSHDEPDTSLHMPEFADIVTRSPSMKRVLTMVTAIAPTDANVLLYGENGTGKELIADAIHRSGPRAGGPFVKINCAAIPAELIESELFGYKRGAFTGAVADKVGLFEQARGGTLMLDEIGEMPPHLQVKLLRVLQERAARPLGGQKPVEIDFRLICSTNCDLHEAIQAGRFREDLYFRINTIAIEVPPLRERREDVALLAEHFRTVFAREYGRPVKRMRRDVMPILMRHDWRGNVRELQHVIEHAVILAGGEEITPDDLPESLNVIDDEKQGDRVAAAPDALTTLAEIERSAIVRTLAHTRGNKRAAAAILGLYRPTLYSKLRKYGISTARGAVAREDSL